MAALRQLTRVLCRNSGDSYRLANYDHSHVLHCPAARQLEESASASDSLHLGEGPRPNLRSRRFCMETVAFVLIFRDLVRMSYAFGCASQIISPSEFSFLRLFQICSGHSHVCHNDFDCSPN